jgi:hypothetical protein
LASAILVKVASIYILQEDKMNKRNRIDNFFPVQTTGSTESGPSTQASDNIPHVTAQLRPGDIESDPGLRRPIENLDPAVRDIARREYISKGPCQPTNHSYERTWVGNGYRSFHDYWYNDHRGWLEYSVSKNAAFCFYCFLFKQPRAENFGIEAFTKNGFKTWKDGPSVLNRHVGKHDSGHNKARQHYMAFKNQRQNLPHVIDRGTNSEQEKYKARLLILLGVVKFLLLQGLAFRGHDESSTSKNKGNFKEMLEWYTKKDPEAEKLIAAAGENHKMTSPEIQLELCKACAQETSKAIIEDIEEAKIIERFQGYRSRKDLLPRPRSKIPDFASLMKYFTCCLCTD